MHSNINEARIMAKYCTADMVHYGIDCIEACIGREVTIEDTLSCIESVQASILEENSWEIGNMGVVNFKELKRMIGKRVRIIVKARIMFQGVDM